MESLSFLDPTPCARHWARLFVQGAGDALGGSFETAPPHWRPSLIMMKVSPREVEDEQGACRASVLCLPCVPKLVNEFLFR